MTAASARHRDGVLDAELSCLNAAELVMAIESDHCIARCIRRGAALLICRASFETTMASIAALPRALMSMPTSARGNSPKIKPARKPYHEGVKHAINVTMSRKAAAGNEVKYRFTMLLHAATDITANKVMADIGALCAASSARV